MSGPQASPPWPPKGSAPQTVSKTAIINGLQTTLFTETLAALVG